MLISCQVLLSSPVKASANLHFASTPLQLTDVAQGRKNPLWMGLPLRLRRTRNRAGLSLRQVALISSCSQPTLSLIEGGRRTSIDVVERIAAGLGIPVYWLAYGPEAHLPFRQKHGLPDRAYDDPETSPSLREFRERYRGCGARVRQRREDLGLTLKVVAEHALISDQAVLNTELGATVPKLDTLEAIAVALDVAPGWLAYGDEEE